MFILLCQCSRPCGIYLPFLTSTGVCEALSVVCVRDKGEAISVVARPRMTERPSTRDQSPKHVSHLVGLLTYLFNTEFTCETVQNASHTQVPFARVISVVSHISPPLQTHTHTHARHEKSRYHVTSSFRWTAESWNLFPWTQEYMELSLLSSLPAWPSFCYEKIQSKQSTFPYRCPSPVCPVGAERGSRIHLSRCRARLQYNATHRLQGNIWVSSILLLPIESTALCLERPRHKRRGVRPLLLSGGKS